jgi:hypothetical protein
LLCLIDFLNCLWCGTVCSFTKWSFYFQQISIIQNFKINVKLIFLFLSLNLRISSNDSMDIRELYH